jgi:hypothetical protein
MILAPNDIQKYVLTDKETKKAYYCKICGPHTSYTTTSNIGRHFSKHHKDVVLLHGSKEYFGGTVTFPTVCGRRCTKEYYDILCQGNQTGKSDFCQFIQPTNTCRGGDNVLNCVNLKSEEIDATSKCCGEDTQQTSVTLKSEMIYDDIDEKGAKIFLPLKIGNTPRHLRNLEANVPVFLSIVHHTKRCE